MTGVFLDTIVICSMTGIAIVISGAYDPSLKLEGINVTVEAFIRGLSFLPHGKELAPVLLMSSLIFLAFTTILGWNFYTEKCLEYLIGPDRKKVLFIFRSIYIAIIFIGPYLTISAVWGIADISNGLMAFPNLFAGIFTNDTVLVDYTSWALRIFLLCGFSVGFQISCQQAFMALGQAKISLFMACLRKLILLIPLIFILPNFFQNKALAVFLAEPVSDIIAAAATTTAFFVFFRRLMKGKTEESK